MLAASSPAFAQIEGYGKNTTGGAGRAVCTVTSSAEQGTGTWDSCVQKGGNQTIQFAVSSATVYRTSYLKSNTTVDGCANGRSGVTLYQPANRHRTVAIQGPAANVVVRCIRFQSTGKRSGYLVEEDLLRLDGTGGPVSKVAVDHCTFVDATDGALDITGNVSDVTASWNLFYGTPLTQLIKYGTRQRISLNHNVYTAGGERNPEIKGNARDIDFVSNVVYNETVAKDAVGNTFNPYGTRLWNAGPSSDSPGNVRANLRSNFYAGANAHLIIKTEPGGSANGIYIGPDNVCAGGCPSSPAGAPSAVTAAYAVTATPVGCMASQMLPAVGSPNRNATDKAKLGAVIAALPDDCPKLTVAKAGTGSGAVTSSPAGINCGSDCTQGYGSRTVVTLSPTPASDSVFTGWRGACSGTGSCKVTMGAAESVTATFELLHTLTVAKTGGGIVTSSPVGINCGNDCSQRYAAGTVVTLSPTPASGSAFAGWSGACSGTGTCQVTMAAAKSVTATFKVLYVLTVAKAGSGRVTSSPAGISCGSDCTQRYTSGTVVTLSPTPAPGSAFTGWSGACSGTGTCQVSMAAAKSVVATFKPLYALTVAKMGSGSVISSPAGISCGSDCAQSYTSGTVVTLKPTPASGSVFTGWSGACSGTGSCQVTMAAAKSVTATFKVLYTLTVAKTGGGIVTSSPVGINCGNDCSQRYVAGTVVTLSPTPASGSAFAGWSGACTGTGTCQVSLAAAKSVTATFKVLYMLTVARAGSGSVTSSPAGVACGSDCTQRYTSGTVVTLKPSPGAGSLFAGWSGGCSGTGTCQVTMNAPKSVKASFQSNVNALNITIQGNGFGNVRSSPSGIDCGSDCVRTLTRGTIVSLTGVAEAGSTFRGWSGPCSGTAACRLTMDEAKGVTAVFSSRSPGGYYTLLPCRAVDTRDSAGPYGGHALAAGHSRVISLTGICGIPSSARAVSLNLTVTQPTTAGNLLLYPADVPLPVASSLDYAAGETRSNALIVGLSSSGAVAIGCAQASGTAHVIIDVTGYFE